MALETSVGSGRMRSLRRWDRIDLEAISTFAGSSHDRKLSHLFHFRKRLVELLSLRSLLELVHELVHSVPSTRDQSAKEPLGNPSHFLGLRHELGNKSLPKKVSHQAGRILT